MEHRQPKQPVAAPAGEWASGSHVRTVVVMAATVFGGYLCYRMAVPFLPALSWALALAVLFTPFHRWLESRIRHPSAAALLSICLIGLLVVVPAVFVGQRLIVESAKGAERIRDEIGSGDWRRVMEREPRLAALAGEIDRQMDLPGSANALTAWLSGAAGSIVRGSIFQMMGFVLTFYLLFFLLRDRAAALRGLRSLSPLPKAEMDRLLLRVGDTIHATIYGTLVVAALQGLLGGLMFWWLGLAAPLLWGLIMALLAVVPVLGAFVIWAPAALFLVLDGSWGKAVILVLWGMLVVGTVDNLLRPVLVGNRLKLHTVLSFISVVGGLMQFGPAGLILGPVILTITMVLLEIRLHHQETDGGRQECPSPPEDQGKREA